MVTEKTIKDLTGNKEPIKVTFTFPTEKVGDKRRQNPIRLKNLISQAEDQLKAKGLKDEADTFLTKSKDLLGQPRFWSNVENGMAIYLTSNFFEVFKLPYSLSEMVYVNTEFRITPLLPMISMNGSFCVLAVSREQTRLIRCTRTTATDITPEDVPGPFREWLKEKPEQQVQFHTRTREGSGAIYFGHGATEEDDKELVEQYFREVEKVITKTVKNINDPLILSGIEKNIAFYRKITRYNRVLDNEIRKNPDDLTDTELRDRGWQVIRDYFLGNLYKAVEIYRERPKGRVSNDPSEIITSTVMGKASAIFITKDHVRWGKYDEKNHKVHYKTSPGNGDVDLMNWLSIKGLETGSNVYILPPEEMPDQAEVSALFRF